MKINKKKTLGLAVIVLLLNASAAFANPSSDWNNSWSFQSEAERANALAQALEMEFVEEGGFNINNNSFWTHNNTQYCDVTGACENYDGESVAIGNQINIEGDNNEVDSDNDGDVSSQITDGEGHIDN